MRFVLWLASLGLVLVGFTVGPARRGPGQKTPVPLILKPALARTLVRAQLPLVVDIYYLRLLNLIGNDDSADKNAALFDYASLLCVLRQVGSPLS